MAAARGSGNAFVALIVGLLVAATIAIGWFVWSGRSPVPTTPAELDVNLKLPPAPSLPNPAPMPNPQPTPLPRPGLNA